ncbi:hypothetical protein KIPB_013061 [Kipferlia bialata]|uniref:Uncharacterized protein n=1 Tax=Kipferlia bialata TaxID=797122 RepID=A0A391NY94_9EUKA|nr:hypothetical protein KIPB_013061 [Kipferlia bialata]|eukprot:g13061.t1
MVLYDFLPLGLSLPTLVCVLIYESGSGMSLLETVVSLTANPVYFVILSACALSILHLIFVMLRAVLFPGLRCASM